MSTGWVHPETDHCQDTATVEGVIRPARAEDLPQVYDIWYEAEVGDEANPPTRRDVPPFFQHELRTGDMYVVERDSQVVAFATLITRDGISYLAEFFVARACQSTHIGARLLSQVLPRDGRTCCTLSSRDPRALALYIRQGMRPLWPNFLLRASTADLGALPSAEVEIVGGWAGDPAFISWDAEVSGRHRPVDHAFWVREAKAVPVWFQRQGETVGYGYIQMRSDGSCWYPDAITLGPIGARTAEDALACVCAAVRWARPRAEAVRIAVPGPHPSLGPLLKAGFRITYVETFVSTSSDPIADIQRYIPSPGLF